ncbi:DEAD/DEAH box helicase [Bulleidia sp. zg-1006]|uniref:DEAD/DEAH box helicase n=1 Tax=Bulleidia sp. zg-1006 TaxID=2806552 RepID=UPI001939A589|nr:DEAD/DEAH box helicase [Bulleidia sp. zg-1006]QRG87372.1 DEAD/DEAH box helicase [Bulleidia sp. zg-1006]
MTFNELNLIQPLLDSLKKANYEQPSPIQEKAIPVLLEGYDLIACAQTGTGKTATFALPILQSLPEEKEHTIRALILTPTRELASQIFDNIKMFGRYRRFRACCVYGGAPSGPQLKALRSGCDILIATPGRLLDYLEHGKLSLKQVEFFVLDEADRMLDMGFITDIRKIVMQIPKERTTALFSATMPKEIQVLAKDILNHPKEVRIETEKFTAETIDQYLIYTEKASKKKVLVDLLGSALSKKVIVFTRTKIGADRLEKYLKEKEIPCLAIHGNKTQGQRLNALQRFRTNQVKVLLATDVAARGIDIKDITHVINFDLPEDIENYVHRIGRTGRANKEGVSISLVCKEELNLLASIEDYIQFQIPLKQSSYSLPLERKKKRSLNLNKKAKRNTETKKPSSMKMNHKKKKSFHEDLIPQKEVSKKAKKIYRF